MFPAVVLAEVIVVVMCLKRVKVTLAGLQIVLSTWHAIELLHEIRTVGESMHEHYCFFVIQFGLRLICKMKFGRVPVLSITL